MKILTRDSNEEIIVIDEELVEGNKLGLTDEETTKLKKLLDKSDELLKLLNTTKDEDEDEEFEDEDEESENEDEESENEDEKNKKKSKKDSFSSIGATHKKKIVGDSDEDIQLSIEDAWSKRFKGGK